MKLFKLVRVSSIKDGTFGVLMDGDIPFAVTLEREWLNNQKGISCIPCDDYICKRINSPQFGNTFEVTNVPGRTLIEIHMGNILANTHGCIILGEQFEPLNGENAVLSSGPAFREFLKRTTGLDEFLLSIRKFIL